MNSTSINKSMYADTKKEKEKGILETSLLRKQEQLFLKCEGQEPDVLQCMGSQSGQWLSNWATTFEELCMLECTCVCAHTSVQHSSESTVVDLLRTSLLLPESPAWEVEGGHLFTRYFSSHPCHLTHRKRSTNEYVSGLYSKQTHQVLLIFHFSEIIPTQHQNLSNQVKTKTSHTPKSNQEKRKQRPVPWAPSQLSLPSSSPTVVQPLNLQETLLRNSWGASRF